MSRTVAFNLKGTLIAPTNEQHHAFQLLHKDIAPLIAQLKQANYRVVGFADQGKAKMEKMKKHNQLLQLDPVQRGDQVKWSLDQEDGKIESIPRSLQVLNGKPLIVVKDLQLVSDDLSNTILIDNTYEAVQVDQARNAIILSKAEFKDPNTGFTVKNNFLVLQQLRRLVRQLVQLPPNQSLVKEVPRLRAVALHGCFMILSSTVHSSLSHRKGGHQEASRKGDLVSAAG